MADIKISSEIFLAMAKNILFDVPLTNADIEEIQDKVRRMSAREQYISQRFSNDNQ